MHCQKKKTVPVEVQLLVNETVPSKGTNRDSSPNYVNHLLVIVIIHLVQILYLLFFCRKIKEDILKNGGVQPTLELVDFHCMDKNNQKTFFKIFNMYRFETT